MTNDEAISLLNKITSYCYFVDGYGDMIDSTPYYEAVELAIKALEQEPKMGHWIEEEVFDGELGYRCSECGGLFCLESGTPKDNQYNFCPKCGARMVESEE